MRRAVAPTRKEINVSVLKEIVPISVKTRIKNLQIIRSWNEHKKLVKQYDGIMSEVYDPQLMSHVEDVHIAEIEINRNCNINCVMCNTSLSTRPQFNMDIELFEHAVKYTKGQGDWPHGSSYDRRAFDEQEPASILRYFAQAGCENPAIDQRLILHKHLDLVIDYSRILSMSSDSRSTGRRRNLREESGLGGKLGASDHEHGNVPCEDAARRKVSSTVNSSQLSARTFGMSWDIT